MVVPTIFLKSRVYCIVHWNDLSTNEINKVLFFSEGQKCFVLGWRSQNSDETKYHLHISETFISTRCSLDSNIRFIKPPKAQQLCWFPTLEASLDKIRIISTKPRTVLFVRFFFLLVHTSVYFYRSSSISLHGY